MQKQKKKATKKAGPWGQIQLGGFRAEFPQPRIPRLLGSDRDLTNRNSVYPTVLLDVPITPQSGNIVAGAIASSVALDTTIIPAWATRFQTLFREYAICGASLEIRLNNVSTTSGLVLAWMEESSSAAPVFADGVDKPRVDMTCGPLFVPRAYHIKWSPRDILDLDYSAVSTNFTPAWLKVFCNVANTFTAAGTTGQVLITGTLALTFRGYV